MKRTGNALLIVALALGCGSFSSALAGIWLHSTDWGLTSFLMGCTAGICAFAGAIMRI